MCVQVPGIYQQFVLLPLSLQQVPRSYCCTKRVTPLESSHGHNLPARAASARAARGGCFNPKRAATAPGCRTCSANREHRVGSRRVVINYQCFFSRFHGKFTIFSILFRVLLNFFLLGKIPNNKFANCRQKPDEAEHRAGARYEPCAPRILSLIHI